MAESKHRERVPRLGLTLALFLVIMALLFGVLITSDHRQSAVFAQSGTQSGAQSATQSPPVGEAFKQLRATEDAILTTYGWVDREKGVVRIPIDRAIDLLAQRGLPTRGSIIMRCCRGAS